MGSVEVTSLTGTREATLHLDDEAPEDPLSLLVPYALLADMR